MSVQYRIKESEALKKIMSNEEKARRILNYLATKKQGEGKSVYVQSNTSKTESKKEATK